MKKATLNNLGNVLVVDNDQSRAEEMTKEILSFPGNKVEVVGFKFLAMTRLAGLQKYDFVLLRDQGMLYPELAMEVIRRESDLFELD